MSLLGLSWKEVNEMLEQEKQLKELYVLARKEIEDVFYQVKGLNFQEAIVKLRDIIIYEGETLFDFNTEHTTGTICLKEGSLMLNPYVDLFDKDWNYIGMINLDPLTKQCSKCQEWFLEEELETTNLVEGSFCEQCLQDLKEMK